MMPEQTTAEAIEAAWRSLAADGRMPTIRAIRAEMLRQRGVGASLRDIAPIAAQLRDKASRSPSIRHVVARFHSLDPVAQREALRIMQAKPTMTTTDAIERLSRARSQTDERGRP